MKDLMICWADLPPPSAKMIVLAVGWWAHFVGYLKNITHPTFHFPRDFGFDFHLCAPSFCRALLGPMHFVHPQAWKISSENPRTPLANFERILHMLYYIAQFLDILGSQNPKSTVLSAHCIWLLVCCGLVGGFWVWKSQLPCLWRTWMLQWSAMPCWSFFNFTLVKATSMVWTWSQLAPWPGDEPCIMEFPWNSLQDSKCGPFGILWRTFVSFVWCLLYHLYTVCVYCISVEMWSWELRRLLSGERSSPGLRPFRRPRGKTEPVQNHQADWRSLPEATAAQLHISTTYINDHQCTVLYHVILWQKCQALTES